MKLATGTDDLLFPKSSSALGTTLSRAELIALGLGGGESNWVGAVEHMESLYHLKLPAALLARTLHTLLLPDRPGMWHREARARHSSNLETQSRNTAPHCRLFPAEALPASD